ncbi:hypothetical protein ACQP2T_23785 [Nonomuraea sp. CA-143628]|uniref:hypothetical protein n=1 Tax=Nonomuraea sp. CA-143628 TaxID=3239997 RepID=UPI003D92C6A3
MRIPHVERIAALDPGKSMLEACVRIPHLSRAGRRLPEVRSYESTTAHLRLMIEWLREHGVARVVMEATSSYWRASTTCWRPESSKCGWSIRGM